MARTIFVNLPVADVARATASREPIGKGVVPAAKKPPRGIAA